MRNVLGLLAVSSFTIFLAFRLDYLLEADPRFLVAWIALMLFSIPFLFLARFKYRRGDFDR